MLFRKAASAKDDATYDDASVARLSWPHQSPARFLSSSFI
jgi:hypothetical protein